MQDADAFAHVVKESYCGLPADHVPADMPLYHAEYHLDFMTKSAGRASKASRALFRRIKSAEWLSFLWREPRAKLLALPRSGIR